MSVRQDNKLDFTKQNLNLFLGSVCFYEKCYYLASIFIGDLTAVNEQKKEFKFV